MRRLIIDGQLFQTPAWHRGMGKYSIELLSSLREHNKKNRVWDSIELLLSNLIETESEIIETVKKVLPGVKITLLALKPAEVDNLPPTEKNRSVVESHLATTIAADEHVDFLILSVLQGGIAPAFPERAKTHKILLFYDLIPLIFFKIYLSTPRVREEYTTHLGEFLRADTYLAISKTVANDLAWHMGVSHKRIFHITGGPIAHGRDIEPMDIPKPFILMHTGDDLRKNNRRGILAFEDFNKRHENKYTLVVSSTFTDHERRDLMRLSKNVIFTGRVTGGQLNYLYKESEALFYPTEYEGFGLPVLEAMEWNRPVLCSNIPLFREISPSLFEYFDHRDIKSMSSALAQLVKGKVVPDSKAYKKILGRYTWEVTAKDALKGILRTNVEPTRAAAEVVVFSPNPSQSVLGRHVQLLDGELRKLLHLTYRYEGCRTKVEQRINYTAYITPGSSVIDGWAPLDCAGKLTLYHLANEPTSAKALFAALGQPGVAVLYEDSLQTVWETLKSQGLVHASRLRAEAVTSQKIDDPDGYLTSLVASQKAIVVHSHTLLKKLQKLAKQLNRTDLKLVHVPLPTVETVYPEILPQQRAGKLVFQNEDLRTSAASVTYNLREGFKTPDGKSITDHRLLELLSESDSLKVPEHSVIGDLCAALAQALGTNDATLTAVQRRKLAENSREERSYQKVAQAIYNVIQEVENES